MQCNIKLNERNIKIINNTLTKHVVHRTIVTETHEVNTVDNWIQLFVTYTHLQKNSTNNTLKHRHYLVAEIVHI